MKRSLQHSPESRFLAFVASAIGLVAATGGLVRMGYGLFLPDFVEAFAVSPSVAGLLASGASMMYCLAAGIAYFHARAHPRAIAVAAGATAAAAGSGIALAGDLPVFALSVLLGGAGAGFASPAMVELIRRNIGLAQQAPVQSVVNCGSGFGLVCAGLLALVVADAWRLAWLLMAVATFAAMSSVLAADAGGRPAGATAPAPGARPDLRWYALPVAAAFVFGAGSAAMWMQGRTLLESVGGIGAHASAGAWIALGVGAVAAAVVSGWMARWSVEASWSATVAAAGFATVAVALFPQVTGLSYGACALFGLAFTVATSVLILWAGRIQEDSAAGTSLLFVALVLGQSAGAVLSGALAERRGLGFAFLVAAGICVLSGALVAGRGPGEVPWRRVLLFCLRQWPGSPSR